ncbi:hypothetical protein TH25_01480 [Thalassospira profundimaris]|uniref:Uncharacterized protein n=1 Tax=Thalassospira profundimaris TaxID=502049 RepID=A0A367XK89_9PROT|nr:hypothetical protein TH25_01480 [Thalassospira profundimaris]
MKIAQIAMLVRRMVEQFLGQSLVYTFRKRGIFYFSYRVHAGIKLKYAFKCIFLKLITRPESEYKAHMDDF